MINSPILKSLIRPGELSEIFKRKSSSTSHSWTTILLYIFYIILIIGLLWLGLILYKRLKIHRRKKKDSEKFNKLCEDKNLTLHQIKIIQSLAKKYDKIPSILLTNKKEFSYVMLKENKFLLSKYHRSHPVYVDFDSNINYIKTVFAYKKPVGGEVLRSSRDIHSGTSVIVYRRLKGNMNPVKGVIVYMDNNKFIVRIPKKIEDVKPLLEKDIKLYIFFNHKADGNYEFETMLKSYRVIDKSDDKELVFVFEHSERLIRRQRRKYIRVRVKIPVVVNTEIFNDKNVPVSINGNIVDLSIGGFCFKSTESIPKNIITNMTFYLEELSLNNVLGKVLRVQTISDGFLHHMSFVDLNDKVHPYIKRFVSKNMKRRV